MGLISPAVTSGYRSDDVPGDCAAALCLGACPIVDADIAACLQQALCHGKANVHPSTVSRVLNPGTRSMVSKAVADRVTGMADEMGYRRSPQAAKLLLERIRNAASPVRTVNLLPKLIIRGSTAAPAKPR